jgi:hypothetical protein
MIHCSFQYHLQNTTSSSDSTPSLQPANASNCYYSLYSLMIFSHRSPQYPSIATAIDSINPAITCIVLIPLSFSTPPQSHPYYYYYYPSRSSTSIAPLHRTLFLFYLGTCQLPFAIASTATILYFPSANPIASARNINFSIPHYVLDPCATNYLRFVSSAHCRILIVRLPCSPA